MRTNSRTSAEFYEAQGRSDISDGTLMFKMSVQQLSDCGVPALDVDQVATEENKKHYPAAWGLFLESQNKVIEVALENQEAIGGGQ